MGFKGVNIIKACFRDVVTKDDCEKNKRDIQYNVLIFGNCSIGHSALNQCLGRAVVRDFDLSRVFPYLHLLFTAIDYIIGKLTLRDKWSSELNGLRRARPARALAQCIQSFTK